MTRILIVDDDRATSAGMADVVEEWGYEAEVTDDLASAWKSIQKLVPDIALLDLRLPDGSGLDLLRQIKEDYADVPVIILTGHASVDSAVDALKEGAEDYLTKPVDLSRLEVMLRNLQDKQDLRQEVLELRRQLQKMGALGHLVGKSPAMQKLFQEIEMVAGTDANVFIVGESGSGKEVVSNTIHTLSRRKNKPFVAFNCGAISPTLIESEIFGHEKGAFTNAVKRREGYFELAKGGTVFLDEITEMPLDLQVKLLRVLEEGKFRRVGGNQEIEIDARIVAASNRDPIQAIEDGRLREDLYYRLNVFPIEVPPLRERKEDIPLFAFHFLSMLNEQDPRDVEVDKMSPQFQEELARYDWPGNVRELRNIINRAFIMARGDTLTVDSLPDKFLRGARRRKTSLTLPIGTKPLDDISRLVAQETLVWAEGNRERAAESLGLTEKEYDGLLETPREDDAESDEAESSKKSASDSRKKPSKKAAKKSSKKSSKTSSKKSSGKKSSKKKTAKKK